MSEDTAVDNTSGISACRIVHLLVRIVLAITVFIFATSLSQPFRSWYHGTPLVSLSFATSFVLPIIAILESIIVHSWKLENRGSALFDVVVTSLWAFALIALVMYGFTHYVVL